MEGEALSFLSCLYSYGQKTNVAYLNDLGRTWPGVKIVKGGAFKNPNLYSPFKKYACLPFLPEVISRPEIEKCPWGTYGVEVVFDFAGKACGDIALALDKEPLGSIFEISGFLAPRSQRSRQMIVHITQYSQGV